MDILDVILGRKVAGKLSAPSIFNDYNVYDCGTVADTWKTLDYTAQSARGFAYLDLTVNEFLDTWYNSYLGTGSDGYSVSRKSLGKDSSGLYDIYEYAFIPKSPSFKIMLTSGLHTYELPASFGLAHFVKGVMEKATTELEYIYNNVEMRIIPIQNPWGWSQYPKTYGNYNGVNINRNYNVTNEWENFNDNGDEWNQKGSAPFDQAETCILRDWALANKDALFWIDCHTDSANDDYTSDVYYLSNSILYDMVNDAVDKLESWTMTKYDVTEVNSYKVLDSPGSIRQVWSEQVAGIPTITVEQSPASEIIGNSTYNNSGNAINNYCAQISAYVFQFLIDLNILNNNKISGQKLSDLIIERIERLEDKYYSVTDVDYTELNYEHVSVASANGAETSSTNRITTDFVPIEFNESGEITLNFEKRLAIADSGTVAVGYTLRFYDSSDAFVVGSFTRLEASTNGLFSTGVSTTGGLSGWGSGKLTAVKNTDCESSWEPTQVRIAFRTENNDTLTDLDSYIDGFMFKVNNTFYRLKKTEE